jgi:hypothetical protein
MVSDAVAPACRRRAGAGREYETGELVNEFVFERRVEVGV